MRDKKLVLATALDIGSMSSSSNIVGDILDFGTGKNNFGSAVDEYNFGEGGDMELVIYVDTEDIAGGASTLLTFTLEQDSAISSSDLTSGTAIITKAITGVTASALDIGGEVFRGKIPAQDIQRYMVLRITSSGGVPSAGKFGAYIALAQQTPMANR